MVTIKTTFGCLSAKYRLESFVFSTEPISYLNLPIHFTQIESAKEIPSLRTISRVADALQVEPYELLIPENISTSHHDCECVQVIEKRIRQELVDRVIAALED